MGTEFLTTAPVLPVVDVSGLHTPHWECAIEDIENRRHYVTYATRWEDGLNLDTPPGGNPKVIILVDDNR